MSKEKKVEDGEGEVQLPELTQKQQAMVTLKAQVAVLGDRMQLLSQEYLACGHAFAELGVEVMRPTIKVLNLIDASTACATSLVGWGAGRLALLKETLQGARDGLRAKIDADPDAYTLAELEWKLDEPPIPPLKRKARAKKATTEN